MNAVVWPKKVLFGYLLLHLLLGHPNVRHVGHPRAPDHVRLSRVEHHHAVGRPVAHLGRDYKHLTLQSNSYFHIHFHVEILK